MAGTQPADTEYLFPPEVLKDLLNQDENRFDRCTAELQTRKLALRPLHIQDFSKNYMELLAQHTTTGTVTEAIFSKQFRTMQSYGNVYYIVVVENLVSGKIVATGTLEIEHKFIHSAALRGRIEDVVIDKETEIEKYRYTEGNLATIIMDVVTSLGKTLGCYKISLESENFLLDFYNAFGYRLEKGQNYMVVRFRS